MKRFLGILAILCLTFNLSIFASKPLSWYLERTNSLSESKILEIERELLSDLGNLAVLEHFLYITGLATYQDLLTMPLAEKNGFGKEAIVTMLRANLASSKPSASVKPASASAMPASKPSLLPPSPTFVPVTGAGAGSGIVAGARAATGSGYSHRTKIADRSNKKTVTELLAFTQSNPKNVFIIEDLLNIINPATYSYQNLIGMRLDQKYTALVSELNKIINPAASTGSSMPAINKSTNPTGTSVSPVSSASVSGSSSPITSPVTAPIVLPATGLGPNAQILVEKGVASAHRLVGIDDAILAPYAKQAKVGTPAPAIENKMITDKVISAAAPVSAPKPSAIGLPIPVTGLRPMFDLSSAKLKPVASTPAPVAAPAPKPAGPISMMDQLKAAQAKKGILAASDTDAAGSTGSAGAGSGFNPAKSSEAVSAPVTTTWGRAGSKPSMAPKGFVSSRPPRTSTNVSAGAGTGPSTVLSEVPEVDISTLSGVAKYKELLKRRTPNDKLLEYLLAPKPVTKETIESIAQHLNDQDISNKEILDYLLEHKFNQPKATVDTMLYEHKQVDLKRRLIPFDQRKDYNFRLSPSYNRGRSWIEFFSPSNHMHIEGDRIIIDTTQTNRHLDYNKLGIEKLLYLIDSNTFGSHDYMVFPKVYKGADDFYWTKDGKQFLIVYGKDGLYKKFREEGGTRVNEGYSQLYDWITGEPVSPPMPPVVQAVEISPEEVTRAMKKALKTAIDGESKIHFAARGPASLKFTGELTEAQIADPDYLAALAIHYIDTELPLQLSDDQVNVLKNPAYFMPTIEADLAKDPNTADSFTKAKVYCAIHSGGFSEITSPNIVKWRKALNTIVANYMKKYNLTPTVGQNGINGSAFGETLSKFTLDIPSIREMQNPDLMTREIINALTGQDNVSATNLDQAKIFYGIKAGLVDASNPDLERWKGALEIYE